MSETARPQAGSGARVAVLISGRGSNMRALVAAAMETGYPAKIVGVFSDKADASGLDLAREFGIPAKAIPRAGHDSKAAHEAAVLEAIAEVKPDFVCLAGYMRLLSADFIARWRGRIINIHPSLLPSFPGLDTHLRAITAGCRVHGCTVHFVTEKMDEGPIIAQAVVPVLVGDTPDALAARVLKAEHRLYPAALAMLASGAVRMSGDGLAVFRPTGNTEDERMLLVADGSAS